MKRATQHPDRPESVSADHELRGALDEVAGSWRREDREVRRQRQQRLLHAVRSRTERGAQAPSWKVVLAGVGAAAAGLLLGIWLSSPVDPVVDLWADEWEELEAYVAEVALDVSGRPGSEWSFGLPVEEDAPVSGDRL